MGSHAEARAAELGGRRVPQVALGCMGLSYRGDVDEEYGIGVIREALDRGLTLLDTADVYGPFWAPGTSERLVRRAVGGRGARRPDLVIATKGGHIRNADDTIRRDGRPGYLRRACEASLRALGTDAIDLYQLHGPDASVPFEESVGALAELQREGKIIQVGLSNVGRSHVETARKLVTVASVQNRFSPLDLSGRRVLEHCLQHGIAFLCWAPLGGPRAPELPALVPGLAEVAAVHGATPYQVALAWEMAQGPGVIPVVGALSAGDVAQAVEACGLHLTPLDMAIIARSLDRHDAAGAPRRAAGGS